MSASYRMDMVSGLGSRTDIAAGANSGSVAIDHRGRSMGWSLFQGTQINKCQLRDRLCCQVLAPGRTL